jgi:two-component system sensor histidine kinase PhoQ
VRQTNDNHLHILVEDDGPGIPLNQRTAVFDRGQRPIRCDPAGA